MKCEEEARNAILVVKGILYNSNTNRREIIEKVGITDIVIKKVALPLFDWFRRLALVADMRTQRIDTIRLKLLKIAARVVKSARYKYFKLCSRCPEKTQGIMSGFKLPEDEMSKSYRRE